MAEQMKESMRDKANLLDRAIAAVDLDKVKDLIKSCDGDTSPMFKAYEELFTKEVMYATVLLYADVVFDEHLYTKLAIVETLVTAGANVYGCTPPDSTLLVLAILCDNLPLADLLIQLQAEIEGKVHEVLVRRGFSTESHWSALTAATLSGPDYIACLYENQPPPTDDEPRFTSGMIYALESILYPEKRRACVRGFMDWFEAHQRPFPSYKAIHNLLRRGDTGLATTICHRATLTTPEIQELFAKAAELGYTTFMRMMIAWHPQLLQSEWLVKREIPAELRGKVDFLRWLNGNIMRSKSVSLQYLCKAVVLRNIGLNPESHVDTLPLPKKTKEFLLSHVESRAKRDR